VRGDIESLSLSLRIEGVFGCDMVASGKDEMELREDGDMREVLRSIVARDCWLCGKYEERRSTVLLGMSDTSRGLVEGENLGMIETL